MKTIQSLTELKVEPVPETRQASRSSRALSQAKRFLTHMLSTEYFAGPLTEGKSTRRQALLEEEFQGFMRSSLVARGPIGKASITHIADFLERYYQYQENNKKTLSVFDLRSKINDYTGAQQ